MTDDQTFSTSETTGTADRKRRTILIGAIILLICAVVAIVLGVLLSKDSDSGTASSVGSTNDRGGIVTSPPTSVMVPITPSPIVAASLAPSSSASDAITSAPVSGTVAPTMPSGDGVTTAPITTAPASVGTTAPAFAPIPEFITTAPISVNVSAPAAISASPAATSVTAAPAVSVTSAPATTTSAAPAGTTTAAPASSVTAAPATTTTAAPAAPTTATSPEAVIQSVALKGGAEFEDPASYQSKALAFVLAGSGTYTDEQLVQRYALSSLYYATNAVITPYSDTVFGTNVIQPWNISTSWATDTDVCTWYGISCDANKLVTQIDLFSNRMTGTLPAELTLITTLVYLDLYDNILYNVGEEGNAWLGNLTNIEFLFYQANYFEYDGVPTHINKLKNLKEYDCSFNLYVGPLTEDNFVGLSNLNYLALGGNAYNSTMPNSLLNLPNLGYLYMDDCFLMGNLDDTLMKLPNIFEFWIDINPGVTGTIPTTFDKVPNLNSLSVSDLSLTGTLPSEIGRLTDMLQMWFYGNALTGSIPTEYGLLTGMTLLQLHFNDFTGVVPTGICSIGIGDLTSDCSTGNVACDCCTECF